jgi:hypothetical protein
MVEARLRRRVIAAVTPLADASALASELPALRFKNGVSEHRIGAKNLLGEQIGLVYSDLRREQHSSNIDQTKQIVARQQNVYGGWIDLGARLTLVPPVAAGLQPLRIT